MRKLVVLFLMFLCLTNAYPAKYYGRHFILLVDQTTKKSTDEQRLYEAMKYWLQGDPSMAEKCVDMTQSSGITNIPPFDPDHDQLSLFAFGIVGSGTSTNASRSDYRTIHGAAYTHSKTPEQVYQLLYESLIHRRSNYQEQKTDFTNFLEEQAKQLFNGQDPLHEAISSYSGVTMSHFVYPLLLNYINVDVPTSEYVILIVSDFKSGSNKGDWEDRNWLSQLLANGPVDGTPKNPDYFNYIIRQINLLGMPFQQVENCKMVSGAVQLIVSRLIVKESLNNPPMFITSNVTLNQENDHLFKMSEVVVNFNLDNNTIVDSVEMVLRDAKGQILSSFMLEPSSWEYDSVKRYFIIDPLKLQLSRSDVRKYPIEATYIFYTTSVGSDGQKLLPFMMAADRKIQESEIFFIDNEKRSIMKIIGITLLTLAILAIAILRGRKKKITAHAENYLEEYVNVTPEKGAVRQSCLFYSKESGNSPAPIPVNGTVRNAILSIPWKSSLYAYVDDSEVPVEGVRYCIENGDNVGKWVPVTVKRGKFKFNVYPLIRPDLDLSNVLDMKIDIKLAVVPSFLGIGQVRNMDQDKIFDYYKEEDHCVFRHYLIEDIGHSWIGIDPGTTGSCVAISGDPQASVTNLKIKLMEATYGSTTTNIVPSRIALNNRSILDKESVSEMVPGVDYIYGIKANTDWKILKNRFQSIKKLLGYKKKGNDLIDVRFKVGGEEKTRGFQGVELAHLLVKGLQKDLDNYIDSLSVDEKRKLMPDGKKPRRAVVAIPNNYTITKTLDMVDSIRMLGIYQEVRFIYEAEGVLFNYLYKTYGDIQTGSENVMVYDMGGATINCSVFNIKYELDDEQNIRFKVKTLARIGYGIGGDTIDVALLETLLTMPPLQHVSSLNDTQSRHEYEAANKTDFLKDIFELKMDVTHGFDKSGMYSNIEDDSNFVSYVNTFLEDPRSHLPLETFYTQTEKNKIEEADNAETLEKRDAILHEVNGQLTKRLVKMFTTESENMKHYVYNNIVDAVEETMRFPTVSTIDKVIFSGRSTGFPQVKKLVIETVLKESKTDNNKNKLSEWAGMSGEEVKTAVAEGACWYGQCGMVELDNSLINGTYGFKCTEAGKSKLHTLLRSDLRFKGEQPLENGKDFASSFAGDGHNICFYQVMGSGNAEDIFESENRHKLNYLGGIHVTNKTNHISISVDRKNMALCKVLFESGHEMELSTVAADHDLSHEQDWPYVFATLNVEQDKDSSESTQSASSDSKSDTKSRTRR